MTSPTGSATTPAATSSAAPTRLSPAELLSALAIVLIWGSNFVVMKLGLRDMGPMLLGALRFALASLPLLLLVRRPALPWRFIAGYGLAQGLGQFGCLFLSLSLGMPAHIAVVTAIYDKRAADPSVKGYHAHG